jgi:16S rRNA (guanine966-N2)-methyltransferase
VATVSAGRVVAGSARGIRLVAPAEGTRSLGDRLKQSLFATLEPALRGGSFLDLFAGSGAAGIEALSRGAATATFVELGRPAIEAIERNLLAAHLASDAAVVIRADVLEWLAVERATGQPAGRLPGAPFGVVFVDPPYDRPELLEGALTRLAAGGPGAFVAAAGIVVTKHGARTTVRPEIGLLASDRERRFGESTLTFYRWAGAEAR